MNCQWQGKSIDIFTRIASECWSATRLEIFDLTQEQCDAGSLEYKESEKSNNDKSKTTDWVAKLWRIITASIHDELYIKLKHVPRGHIPALLSEVRTALMVDSAEDASTL